MATKILYFFTSFLLIPILAATPDCYNFTEGITYKWNSYTDNTSYPADAFPGKRLDWLSLKSGKNCGFYTFSDVYFASYNASL
jgi:hypothetical protein